MLHRDKPFEIVEYTADLKIYLNLMGIVLELSKFTHFFTKITIPQETFLLSFIDIIQFILNSLKIFVVI